MLCVTATLSKKSRLSVLKSGETCCGCTSPVEMMASSRPAKVIESPMIAPSRSGSASKVCLAGGGSCGWGRNDDVRSSWLAGCAAAAAAAGGGGGSGVVSGVGGSSANARPTAMKVATRLSFFIGMMEEANRTPVTFEQRVRRLVRAALHRNRRGLARRLNFVAGWLGRDVAKALGVTAEHEARAIDALARRRVRKREDLRDLGDAPLLDLAQDERLPVARVEAIERVSDRVGELPAREQLLGALAALVLDVLGDVIERLGAPVAPGAEAHERRVGRDPIEPGRELAIAPE